MHALGQKLSVLVSRILGSLSVSSLECDAVSLVLHALWCNKSLDSWCLGVWLCALLLWLNLTTDDELAVGVLLVVRLSNGDFPCYIPDIVLLGETEELPDLRSTLGTQSLWVDNVCQTWDIAITLLDDGEGKDRQILANDATTD